jgi:hypothetical protein
MCVMCKIHAQYTCLYFKYVYCKNILITYYLCTSSFYLRMCTGYIVTFIYLFVFSTTCKQI